MDVRVDNFLDFCKIFYPSRYRLEMKKPGFDFSLLEAEVRENGGIDVNNIFFNGFCVEETDKLDFDNFDIEKQLAKLDNDLDKTKYLINCFDFIFRMPLLPFLPEKDLSIEPYYEQIEIVKHLLKTKIFGINLFEKANFVIKKTSSDKDFNNTLFKYCKDIGLEYIFNISFNRLEDIYSCYKTKNNLSPNTIYSFLMDTWFYHQISGNFTSKIINHDYINNEPTNTEVRFNSYEKNRNYMFFKEKSMFENNFELFKKNKLFLNQDLLINNSYTYIIGHADEEYFVELVFKYSDNLKFSVKLKAEMGFELNYVYLPLPLTENINTKLELKNYRKKVLKNNGFNGPLKNNTQGVNKNGGQSSTDGFQVTLSFYSFRDFCYLKIIPKNPEQDSDVVSSVNFFSKDIYGLIEKKDFINTDTTYFTERFINKSKRYLMRNRNDKLFESVPNEMLEKVVEEDSFSEPT
nr:MAG TPA: hypothetical protein [Caudoviricetes sp.]